MQKTNRDWNGQRRVQREEELNNPSKDRLVHDKCTYSEIDLNKIKTQTHQPERAKTNISSISSQGQRNTDTDVHRQTNK